MNHHILIVGNKKKMIASLQPVLELEDIDLTFAATGETGIRKLETAGDAFSLIISDQRLSDMPGTRCLERARKIAPDTIRFLVTRYSDMETIIDSVNKGSVHRYVLSTGDREELLASITIGLEQYEAFLENEKSLREAQVINKKLYRLDRELMATTKSLAQKHAELNREIERLEKALNGKNRQARQVELDAIIGELEAELTTDGSLDTGAVNGLFLQTAKALFLAFNHAAKRSGFEMPKTVGGSDA